MSRKQSDRVFLAGQLYGLEKFWAFMKYYKNGDKLSIDPVLKGYLSKFKTIEDFRVVEPELNEMLQGVGSLNRSKFLHRHRSVSESEGVAVAGNSKYHRPNTTITNRSDYIGPQNPSSSRNANQYQHQQQQQQHQPNSNNNRRRTGSFGSGTVRIRSGSLGNKPQVVRRTGSRNDLNRVQTVKTSAAAAAANSSSSSSSVDRKPKSEK